MTRTLDENRTLFHQRTDRLTSFLTVAAAAALAGVSVRTMRRNMDRDHIKLIAFGHKFKILRRDFEAWLLAPKAARKYTKASERL